MEGKAQNIEENRLSKKDKETSFVVY